MARDALLDLHCAETAWLRRREALANGEAESRLIRTEPGCPVGCEVCDFRCSVTYACLEAVRRATGFGASPVDHGSVH